MDPSDQDPLAANRFGGDNSGELGLDPWFATEHQLRWKDVAETRHSLWFGVVTQCVVSHGVAKQLLKLWIQIFGDVRRTRQELILLGAKPREAVGDVEPYAIYFGTILRRRRVSAEPE